MSWRDNSQDFWVAAGATTRILFWYGDPGDDQGVQFAMGHPMAGEDPTSLVTERVAKSVDCTIGSVSINGAAHYGCGDPASAYWQYWVDIRNDGGSGCRFRFEGGGV
jgi:hypothetical protein